MRTTAGRPGGGSLSGSGARRAEHDLWPHVPIHARVVWADTGLEEWIETTAMGWTHGLVYIDMRPHRLPGQRLLAANRGRQTTRELSGAGRDPLRGRRRRDSAPS